MSTLGPTITSTIRSTITTTLKSEGGFVPGVLPIFSAKLQSSLIPEIAGDPTPTFTRASERTIVNHEGRALTCLAGEAGFMGGRRVRNLVLEAGTPIETSDNLSAANGAALTRLFTGDSTTLEVTASGGYVRWSQSITWSMTVGREYVMSFSMRGSGSSIGKTIAFTHNIGGSIIATTFTVPADWTRFSVITPAVLFATDTTYYFDLSLTTPGVDNGTLVAGESIEVKNLQTEDVTGQTDQNPGEYVSAGVAPADAVEQITNGGFDTDLSGWDNTQAWWTWVAGRAYHALSSGFQGLWWYATPSTTPVVIEFTVEVLQGRAQITVRNAADTADLLTRDYGVGTWNVSIVAPEVSDIFFFRQSGNSSEFYIDDVSLKSLAPYHGANVDGVEYFTTTNGNTVTSGVVTEATGANIVDGRYANAQGNYGFVGGGARTNIMFDSSNLTQWTIGPTTTVAQNQIGMDGLPNSASIVTDSDSNFGYARRTYIPAGSTWHVFRTFIEKDSDTSRLVGLQLRVSNSLEKGITLDTTTGVNTPWVNAGSVGSKVNSYGDYWEVLLELYTANTVALNSYVYPAIGTVQGVAFGGAQGSCVVGNGELYANRRISEIEGTPPIFTTDASVTKAAEELAYIRAGNWPDPAGSLKAQAFVYSSAINPQARYPISAALGGLVIGSGSSPDFIQTFDGANIVVSPTGPNMGDAPVEIGVDWETTNQTAYYNGVAGASGTYKGSWPATVFLVGGGPFGASQHNGTIRNVEIYDVEGQI